MLVQSRKSCSPTRPTSSSVLPVQVNRMDDSTQFLSLLHLVKSLLLPLTARIIKHRPRLVTLTISPLHKHRSMEIISTPLFTHLAKISPTTMSLRLPHLPTIALPLPTKVTVHSPSPTILLLAHPRPRTNFARNLVFDFDLVNPHPISFFKATLKALSISLLYLLRLFAHFPFVREAILSTPLHLPARLLETSLGRTRSEASSVASLVRRIKRRRKRGKRKLITELEFRTRISRRKQYRSELALSRLSNLTSHSSRKKTTLTTAPNLSEVSSFRLSNKITSQLHFDLLPLHSRSTHPITTTH